MPTRIFNPGGTAGTVTLPAPYGQVLTPGTGIITADSPATIISNFAGSDNFIRSGLQLDDAPSGSNIDPAMGVAASNGVGATWTAAQKFITLLLQVWNGAATFVTKFATNATADRTATFPNGDLTVAGIDLAQTWSAVQNFVAGKLKVDNNSTTNAHVMASAATAARTWTIPDVTGGPAVNGVSTAAAGTGASGATAPGFTGTAYTNSGYVAYSAPPTADSVSIVADVDIAAGAQIIAGQPAFPCKLTMVITDANSSITAGTVAFIGTAIDGSALSQTIDISNGGTHTYTTTDAYATVTSITPAALVGNAAGDKIKVGQASALALPIPAGATSVVVEKEAVGATIASTPVDETVGTVDATARTVVPTTAANGTKALHFWFKYQLTPLGSVASHTHTGPSHQHVQAQS